MAMTVGDRDHQAPARNGKNGVVEQVRERLSEAWEFDRDNRLEAVEDLDFLANKQWSAADQAIRNDPQRPRPMLTINRLPQFVRQVTNDIRQADIGIKVVPSDGAVTRAELVSNPKAEMDAPQPPQMPGMQPGGPEGIPPGMGHNQPPPKKKKPITMAEVINGLIREIQYQSSASHVFATAAEHQTACGIGHFRIVTQYQDDSGFDQEIRIKSLPQPLNVYWDPASVEIDRSDANWCVITQMIPRATYKIRYPKAAESDVQIYDDNSVDLRWHTADSIRIAEYWVKKPVRKKRAQLRDGSVIDWHAAVDPEEIINVRDVDTHEIVQYLVSGTEQLDEPTKWPGRHIPIVPVIGSEIPLAEKTYRYGLIRFARDPQRLYNFARTAAAESMAQAPRSTWLVTRKMIGAFKGVWGTANTVSHPYLPYDPDPEAPGTAPQRIAGPEIPAAYVQEAGVSDADIKATIGIYDPQLGQRSSEVSGRAILARDKQGDTGTFHYSDNLRRALEHAGRILVDLIPRVYDNERVIRILGDDDAEMYLPINKEIMTADGVPVIINDLTAGRYDCRVKIGPSYASKRMEAADSMMQFMQAFPQAAPLIGDLIATSFDWPGADQIAERLKRAIPPEVLGEDAPPQPPDPMQDMQAKAAEAQMAELMAKIDQLAAQVDETQAKTQESQARTEKLQAETMAIMAGIGKTEADIAKTHAEAAKTATDVELMPDRHAFEQDRFHLDRADRIEQTETDRDHAQFESESDRAMRLHEMSMRNTTNGATAPVAPDDGDTN